MTRLVPTWGRCLATSGQNGAELQAEAAKRADGYGSGLDIYRSESGLYNICIKGTTFGERALCLTDRPSDKTEPEWLLIPFAEGVLRLENSGFSYDRTGRQVSTYLITHKDHPSLPLTRSNKQYEDRFELSFGTFTAHGDQKWALESLDSPPPPTGISRNMLSGSTPPAGAAVNLVGLYQLKNRLSGRCLNAMGSITDCANIDSQTFSVYENGGNYRLCHANTLHYDGAFPVCSTTVISQKGPFPIGLHIAGTGRFTLWALDGVSDFDINNYPKIDESYDAAFSVDFEACQYVPMEAYVATCADQGWFDKPPVWVPTALSIKQDGVFKPNIGDAEITAAEYAYFNAPTGQPAFSLRLKQSGYYLTEANGRWESSSNLGLDNQQVNRAWDALPVAGFVEANAKNFGVPKTVTKTSPACPSTGAGLSASLQCSCSPTASASGSVWGTDFYTGNSSVCRSAVHRGVVSAKLGGVVTVYPKIGLQRYSASTRNGVASTAYGSYGTTFSFDKLAEPPATATAPTPATPPPSACPLSAEGMTVGSSKTCVCSARQSSWGAVWGSDFYTADSSVCSAAVHQGRITTLGGTITFYVRQGLDRYIGSTRNDVSTADFGSYIASIAFSATSSPPVLSPTQTFTPPIAQSTSPTCLGAGAVPYKSSATAGTSFTHCITQPEEQKGFAVGKVLNPASTGFFWGATTAANQCCTRTLVISNYSKSICPYGVWQLTCL